MGITLVKKPSANALKAAKEKLNEVTVTIMGESNLNYHETFNLDITRNNHFEFLGETYNIPPKDTLHYEPSFWRFDVKMASWFDRHKTWATFLDWFHTRDKAVFETGYLYWKGTADPVDIEMENKKAQIQGKKTDLAMAHYLLEKQNIINHWYNDFTAKLKGKNEGFQNWWIIAAVIIGAVVVGIIMISQGNMQGAEQAVQNVTAPSATPIIIG